MKKIISITHNDLDGIGCPIVIQTMTGITVEPHYCGYHSVVEKLSKALDRVESGEEIENVFITDISFRRDTKLDERIEKINQRAGRHLVVLLDHHATSGWLNKYDWAESYETDSVDGKKKCGTQKVFDYLYKVRLDSDKIDSGVVTPTLENFVKLVNLWDTWRWVEDYPESPCDEANWLNMIYSLKGKQDFFDDYIAKINFDRPIFEKEEKALIDCKISEISKDVYDKNNEMIVTKVTYKSLKKHRKYVADYLKSNSLTDKDFLLRENYKKTFNVGVIFINRNISNVGNALAEKHPELDFIMNISLPDRISLRCVKDLDVPLGIMANYITGSGGGHPKSAGGVLNSDLKNDIINLVLSR